MSRELVICPTARKVEDLLKRATHGGKCVVSHLVTTLPQLVDELWRQSAPAKRVLSDLGERLTLEAALAEARDAGDTNWNGAGIGDCVMALIRQFKSAGVEPADVAGAATTLVGPLRERIGMIARVFARYEAALARCSAIDCHDRERQVVVALHGAEACGEKPRLLNDVSLIQVAEIYDFSLMQFMIVVALIRLIGDARLTIQAEAHRINASRFFELTWNRFVSEESIADRALPDFVRRGGRSGCLGFLVEHIFTGSYPAPPPDDGSVRVIEAPERSREVEEIGRMLRRLLEEPDGEWLRLDRVAIVARDLSLYADHLEEVFARYKLPLEIAYARPLLASAPARTVLNVVRTVRDGYGRAALTELASSPFFRTGARYFPTLAVDIGYIDERTRQFDQCAAVRRRDLVAALERAADEAERLKCRRRLERFDQGAAAWGELLKILRLLDSSATVAVHLERLNEVLNRLHFNPVAATTIDQTSASYGPLLDALSQLAEEARATDSERVVTLAEFAALLETLFAQTYSARRDTVGTGVRALNVMDARGLDFDLVFVLGLNDGEFPRYNADDPLIPDALRPQLNRAFAAALKRRWGEKAPNARGHVLRTRSDHNAEDWFLFFLALSMPACRIVLCHSLNDERGNPVARSPFIEEATKLLGHPAGLVHRAAAEEFIAAARNCFSTGELLNSVAANPEYRPALSGVIPDERLQSIVRRAEIERCRERYLDLPTREELAAVPDDLMPPYRAASPARAALADAYNGRVIGGSGLQRMLMLGRQGEARRWSAAQLSEMASCGFRFFARRIMQLNEEDLPDYEQSALETGGIVHQLLHALVTEADFSDPCQALGTARGLLAAWRERERAGARDPAFFDLAWDDITAMIEEFVAYECARAQESRPEFKLEHPFVFAVRAQPAPETAPLEVVLEGRIDRLELYRDESRRIRAIRVVDYKASRGMNNYQDRLKRELGRTDFQMPVYAMAAREEFAAELCGEAEFSASYMVLRHRDKQTVSRELPVAMLAAAQNLSEQGRDREPYPNRIASLVAAALNGEFEVDPLKCDAWCPYRTVCRYQKSFG